MPRLSISQYIDFGFEDPTLARFAETISEVIRTISNKEILDGQIIPDVFLIADTGTVNKVTHKLGRPVNGYLVIKNNSQSDVWDQESTNLEKNEFLYLLAYEASKGFTTVSLWVF